MRATTVLVCLQVKLSNVEKNKEVVNRLMRTRREEFPDLEAEKLQVPPPLGWRTRLGSDLR